MAKRPRCVISPDGKPYYIQDSVLSEYGTLSGKVELGQDAMLGSYTFQVSYNGQQYHVNQFQVAEKTQLLIHFDL